MTQEALSLQEEQLKENLAHNLQYLRYSRTPPMSQETLARKLGTSRKSITNYENGHYLPPVHVLARIADLFHLSTDTLLRYRLPAKKRKESLHENFTYFNSQEDCRRKIKTDR